jgi:hypothetical protein
MWKNIFLESCLLSALIFGGFYLNTTLLQNELYSDEKNNSGNHISGLSSIYDIESHISGKISEEQAPAHISGMAKSNKNTPQ